jgi:hypothetical protein
MPYLCVVVAISDCMHRTRLLHGISCALGGCVERLKLALVCICFVDEPWFSLLETISISAQFCGFTK